MDADIITKAVANYGFPMALSCYLLLRMESKLEKLSSNIEALTNVIKLCCNR